MYGSYLPKGDDNDHIGKVRTGNTHRVHRQRDIPCHDCWDPASDHLPILTKRIRIGLIISRQDKVLHPPMLASASEEA